MAECGCLRLRVAAINPSKRDRYSNFRESPRDGAKSQENKYRAKQMRYADGGGMNAQREEVEMRTKTKKKGRDSTS